jgi:hypothetical protein
VFAAKDALFTKPADMDPPNTIGGGGMAGGGMAGGATGGEWWQPGACGGLGMGEADFALTFAINGRIGLCEMVRATSIEMVRLIDEATYGSVFP